MSEDGFNRQSWLSFWRAMAEDFGEELGIDFRFMHPEEINPEQNQEQRSQDEEHHQSNLIEVITTKKDISMVRFYLDQGACVNRPDNKGYLPLHCAIIADFIECVELLIEEGAELNSIDRSEATPMMLAAKYGNYKAFEILIKHGAIINYCNGHDVPEKIRQLGFLTYDPLNIAAELNHPECVRLLLENGATPNNVYYMGHELSLIPLQNIKCIEALLEHGSNPNHVKNFCLTPLARACKENKMDVIQLLLRHGADINLQCNKPRWTTPINIAVRHASLSVLETLLNHSTASLLRQDKCKYSPFHEAVLCGRKEVCEMLLKRQVPVDELSQNGRTALMLALNGTGECPVRDQQAGVSRDVVKLLLENGANVNILMPDSGKSIIVDYIRLPFRQKKFAILRLLFGYGAKINLRSCENDPFGVLEHLDKLEHWELFYLVCNASKHIDKDSVVAYTADNRLLEYQRTYVQTPRSLQVLARLFIKERMRKVDDLRALELPHSLTRFLMFE